MFYRVLLLVSIPALLVGACNLDNAHTSSYMTYSISGVKDCARGGYAPENSTCFSYCPSIPSLYMSVKVLLANSTTPMVASERVQKLANQKPDNNNEINQITCVDSTLRQEVAQNLTNVTDFSCRGIVRTLAYGLNRPQWFVGCYTGGMGGGSAYNDNNFCLYHTKLNDVQYTLLITAVDIS